MYLIKNIFIILFLFFGISGYASSFEEVSKSTATIVHDSGLGSGFFISNNLLATNYHVVQGAKNGIVFFVTQQKIEGAGLIIAVDPENDLAIIKTVKNSFKALRMGNSQNVKMGDDVFVIGSPEGLTGTLSKGILSAKRGDGILQITAPISSGSSGSPIFSKGFEVIGIATAVLTTGQNLNFAVSVNKLKALVRKNKITLNQKANVQQKVAQSRNNFSKSFQFYIQKKDKTPADMFQIGWLYYSGKGVVRDYKKAFYWFKKSARQGDAVAQFALGLMYQEGKGVTQDYKKAFYWYEKLAKQGDLGAQAMLGELYYEGKGVTQDYKKAVYWIEKSAKQGEAMAQYDLGVIYYEGKGLTKDHKKAVYWIEKSAKQGFAMAQYNLGVMYYKGEGVIKDYKKAFYWFKKLTQQGEEIAQAGLGEMYYQAVVGAQVNLGVMYYEGKGVKKDYQKALYWTEKLAKQGNANAQYNLGEMYYEGKGVVKNYIQAYKWISLCKAQMTDEGTVVGTAVDQLFNSLESKMTKNQIAEAQKLASQFKIQK